MLKKTTMNELQKCSFFFHVPIEMIHFVVVCDDVGFKRLLLFVFFDLIESLRAKRDQNIFSAEIWVHIFVLKMGLGVWNMNRKTRNKMINIFIHGSFVSKQQHYSKNTENVCRCRTSNLCFTCFENGSSSFLFRSYCFVLRCSHIHTFAHQMCEWYCKKAHPVCIEHLFKLHTCLMCIVYAIWVFLFRFFFFLV